MNTTSKMKRWVIPGAMVNCGRPPKDDNHPKAISLWDSATNLLCVWRVLGWKADGDGRPIAYLAEREECPACFAHVIKEAPDDWFGDAEEPEPDKPPKMKRWRIPRHVVDRSEQRSGQPCMDWDTGILKLYDNMDTISEWGFICFAPDGAMVCERERCPDYFLMTIRLEHDCDICGQPMAAHGLTGEHPAAFWAGAEWAERESERRAIITEQKLGPGHSMDYLEQIFLNALRNPPPPPVGGWTGSQLRRLGLRDVLRLYGVKAE